MYTTLKKWKIGVLGLLAVAYAAPAHAQGDFKCGTDARMKKIYAEHPELELQRQEFLHEIFSHATRGAADDSVVLTIPIVFHIIHQYGSENISDANVINQVSILNRDYSRQNADTATVVDVFKPIIAKVNIQFKLATLDPDGNCTNGINHYYSHETTQGDDWSKLHIWPRNKYLNVWVVADMENGVAGYAYYPSATAGFLATADGIIIRYDYIGSLSPSSTTNSRALTHEIGHYLNLSHTWGSTNDPTIECGNDGIPDTPETKGHDNCSNRFDYTCDNAVLSGTYDFDSVTTTSGSTDPTPVPTQTDSSITFSSFTATGVASNSSSAGRFDFAGWDTGAANGETLYSNMTGAVNTGKYYEFTLDPDFGQGMTLTSITFTVQRDTAGPRTFVVRSNADSYASNLTASISPANADLSVQTGSVFMIDNDSITAETGSKITLTGANFTNLMYARTFRIYAFNAEDPAGTFSVDNVTITGTYGTIENVENYMEYSYCSKMFTVDQRFAMRTTLDQEISYRNNLWTNPNLVETGTDAGATPGTCIPAPDFFPSDDYVCSGDAVTFTNKTWRGTATSYLWDFPGGSPSSSSATSPVVTYTTPGFHTVSLTATNTSGSETKTVTQCIYVSQTFVDHVGPFSESFENSATSDWWISDNDEGNDAAWARVALATSATGSYCYKLNNHKDLSIFDYGYFDKLGGSVDALISPSYDLSHTTSSVLSFKYSCATHATIPDDLLEELKVYSSINCGKSWTLRKTIATTELANAGVSGGNYVPGNNSATFWKTCNISLGASGVQPNIRFKFEYTASDKSNNIYIDDINITGIIGINEEAAPAFQFDIYPNPVNNNQSLVINLEGQTEVMNVVFYDLVGNVIFTKSIMNSNGKTSTEIPLSTLSVSKGVYFVSVSNQNSKQTKKVVVN